jgi:AAA+ ATPase superfamily predicted ATPase
MTSLIGGARTLGQIALTMKRRRGGDFSEYLNDLEKSGFVRKEYPFQPAASRPTNIPRYRISDNYMRFYLKYIEPHRANIEKGLYRRTPLRSIINWDSILGLQFENLVLNNIESLCEILDIYTSSIISVGPYSQNRTLRREQCQIDLLIQLKHALYVCEIKCRTKIGIEIIKQVTEKIRKLKPPQALSVRRALIYQGTLSEELSNSRYFDFFVPFSRFLTEKAD